MLDPTTMGWRDRDFYLDPADTPYLFDSNGNGGTTAWWNGRVVGCWVQDDAGLVHRRAARDLPAAPPRALAVEAERLTDLARRRDGHQRLHLPADEVRATALTVPRRA